MPIQTLYVCDCCGQSAQSQATYNIIPPILGNWSPTVSGVLLCADCCSAVSVAASAALVDRKNGQA
jgi:hypothetical protein